MAYIPDLDEPWDGHTHQEVEDFLKAQIAEISGGQITNTTVSIVGSTAKTYSVTAQSVKFKYKVNNLVNGEFDANFTVVIYVNNVKLPEQQPAVASADDEIETPELASYLNYDTQNADTVSIYAYTENSQSATRIVRYTCVLAELNFDSNVSVGNINPNVIGFIPNFVGSTPKIKLTITTATLNTFVMSDEITEGIQSGFYVGYSLPTLQGGQVYKLTALLSTNNDSVESLPISTEFIVTSSAQTEYLIAIKPVLDAQQYSVSPIEYAVYAKINGVVQSRMNVMKQVLDANDDTTVLNELPDEVDTQTKITWNYQVPYVDNLLRIYMTDEGGRQLGSYRAFEFTATPSSVDWKAPEDYELYLSASGKTNSGAADTWTCIGSSGTHYSTAFNYVEFNNYGSGWRDQKYLRLIAGATAVVNIAPFYDESPQRSFLATGRSIKFRYKVSNVRDFHTPIISCMVGNTGIQIFPDSIFALFNNNQIFSPITHPQTDESHNDRRFPTDTIVEVCFTVQPYTSGGVETNHEYRCYVNGQFAGLMRDSADAVMNQTEKTYITFGSSAATLDLYNVRVYNRCLTSYEVLQMATMDMDDNLDMVNRYEKNQSYSMASQDTVAVSYQSMLTYCKEQVKRGKECAIILTSDNRYGQGSSTKDWRNRKQSVEFIFFKVDEHGNGIVDSTRSKKYEGRAIRYYDNGWSDNFSLRIRTQGTSTAFEIQKNVRFDALKSKDDNDNEIYKSNDGINYTFNPRCDESYRDTGNVNNLPYDRVIEYTWNDQAQAWNTEGTLVKKISLKLFDPVNEVACSKVTIKTNFNESTATRNVPMARWIDEAKRKLASNYPDLLIPPQRFHNINIRQTINGIPAVMFLTMDDNGQILQNPQFSGKVDIITDKSNEGVFGFDQEYTNEDLQIMESIVGPIPAGDFDFSVEYRDNDSEICNFRTPLLKADGNFEKDWEDPVTHEIIHGNSSNSHFQQRWPDEKTVYDNGIFGDDLPFQRMYDFVCSCDTFYAGTGTYFENGEKYTNKISGTPCVKILGEDVEDDAAGNARNRKFKTELQYYLVVSSMLFAGVCNYVLLFIDQVTKNQFITHYRGDQIKDWNNVIQRVLRLIEYDIDTSIRGDNNSRLRLDFTRLFEDGAGIYDGMVSDPNSPFYRMGSAFWELFFNNYKEEMATMIGLLSGSLNSDIKGEDGLSHPMLSPETLIAYCDLEQSNAFNDIIYNADSEFKYLAVSTDAMKAHGSAIEDLRWWIVGRLYFICGKYFNTSYSTYYKRYNLHLTISANAPSTGTFAFSSIIPLTSYVRNYYHSTSTAGHGETGMCDPWDDVSAEHRTVYLDTRATAGLEFRLDIYGTKQCRSIDLHLLYPMSITDWATGYGDVAMEEIILGCTDEGYVNNSMTTTGLGLSNDGSYKFGSCKVFNIAHLTQVTSIDLRQFPVLEEFEASGCTSMAAITLPTTPSLRVLHIPYSISILDITNKPFITEILIDEVPAGSSYALSQVTGNGTSSKAFECMLDIMTNIYE